jgi:hypothetical protein
MPDEPVKALKLRVGIALGCLRRTTVRSFAGCGQSRRRDLHLIPAMADAVAHHVTVSLTVQKHGATVILSRIARHIETVLQDVPHAQARAWAGIDATARDDARHAIAACITRRLCKRYEVLPTPRPTIVPASGVWCGRKDAEPK